MKKVIIALAALAASSAAVAGPKWTYVDAGFVAQSTSEALAGTKDSQGYELTGSFGFDIWHVNGTWGQDETKFVGSTPKTEVDYWRIGGGVHPAVTDNTDFVAEIAYVGWEIKDTSPKVEPDAFEVLIGVRSMVADSLELSAGLATQFGSTDTGGDDDFANFIPSLGGQYFFTDNISVNLEYNWLGTQDIVLGSKDSAKFGVRWSF